MEVDFRETKDTVRVSLQEYLFTGSSRVTSCGFWPKRVRLWDLLEGGLTVLQEPTLTVLLALPKILLFPPCPGDLHLLLLGRRHASVSHAKTAFEVAGYSGEQTPRTIIGTIERKRVGDGHIPG